MKLIIHCHNLNLDYSDFSNKLKEYRSQNNSTNDSVRMATDYYLKNDIMTDYLIDNESEVINMFGFECNSEDERKALIELGEERGTINIVRNLMKNRCWSAEEAMAAMGIAKSEYPRYLALLHN